ncbi:hypothetical protein EVX89_08060 [Clostridioides difficile]|nr:hypothetical protein EVX89_08060 [Clostridioides difficile]
MLHLHLRPINQIVFLGSYPCGGKSYLEVGFALRCFQRLSIPNTEVKLSSADGTWWETAWESRT